MRSGHTGSADRGRWKAALLLGVALFAALPLLLVGFELWRDRTEIAASGERSAENLARLLHEQTARTVQAVDLTLTGMIDTLRLTPGLREHDAAFEHALRQRLAELPYVRALFVIGPDGFITQDSDHPKTPRVSLADRDYFIAHMTDPDIGLHIGRPLRSRSVGVWFVSMSRRIGRPDGGFGGIAVAAVEPRYFERFYTELQLGQGDNIALLSRDGLLIARNPHQDDAIGRSLADTDLFRRYLSGSPAGTFRARSAVDGVPRVFSYRTVDAWPLVVLVGLDKQALFADWRKTAAGASIAGGVFAALVASIAVLLLRQWRRREEVRERMAQVQRLEALGQMTGGIAHDFNNLLMVISGNLDLIERRAGGDGTLRRLAATAAQAAARGTELASRLLAFARQQELTVVAADANTLLSALEDLLRNAAGPKIEIVLKLDPDVRPCLLDAAQFDSAVINLVVNARHAMPSGGRIEISTANDPGGFARRGRGMAGDRVRVTVADAGFGMPPEVLRRAVEPFFTTKGDSGTGLGLSQVYGFVRQVGGDMSIESRVGRGTAIHLFFPRATVLEDGYHTGKSAWLPTELLGPPGCRCIGVRRRGGARRVLSRRGFR